MRGRNQTTRDTSKDTGTTTTGGTRERKSSRKKALTGDKVGYDAQSEALTPEKSEKGGGEDEGDPSTWSDSQIEKEVRKLGEWGAVKKKWISNEPAMLKILNYREQHVNNTVTKVVEAAAGKGHGKVVPKSLGSKALSSDYDITFSGEGAFYAVREFNLRFGMYWGKEAGTVFDTNVYAQNFLQSEKPTDKKDQVEKQEGTDDILEADERHQDVMSLVKVRKNMSKGDWSSFVAKVTAGIEGDRKREAKRRYAEADAIYISTYVGQVIAKIEETPEGKKTIATLMAKHGDDKVKVVEEVAGGADGIAATNRLYEAALMRVEALIRKRKELMAKKGSPGVKAQIDTLTLQIRSEHSNALLFANEPYFAAGTIRHVVGNMQAKFGLELDPTEYFHSMNENFGDIVKDISHYGHGDVATLLIRTSKYAVRFLEAAKQLGDRVKGLTIPPSVKNMEGPMAKLLEIRQGNASGSETEKKRAVEIGKSVGLTDAGTYRDAFMNINVTVNTAFRSMKKKE